jgi:hypothetical protein
VAKRKAKAAEPELTIVGGSAPKARKASKRDFNKASKAEFLSVLAETCNVRRAAREAGVSVGHAYRCRKSDAAFRAGWREALAVAYQRLELVLLERASDGTQKLVKRRDGSDGKMREYSDRLGLTLLKMHRDYVIEVEPRTSRRILKTSANGCSTSSSGSGSVKRKGALGLNEPRAKRANTQARVPRA